MTAAAAKAAKAAIVGGGVIGGGWAARFLLNGWDVSVFDPHPDAAQRIASTLANARRAYPALADVALPAEGSLSFAESIRDAADGADWIQESVPEDLDTKHAVIAEIESCARADAILGSSTSGFRPAELRQGARNPARIIVAHPFNPVYLLPLVEVVAGADAAFAGQACDTLATIGMQPLVVRNEIDAHIADRLMESVWREALWLVNDDIATTGEIDDAIRYGFGLRWAQMGLFETYRLAGGDEGMAHFLRQFGPTLSWPWSRLTDVPELSDELVDKIADQSDAQSGRYSQRELERIRDRNLVGMLRALKERDWAAGATLNEHDRYLASHRETSGSDDASAPLRLLESEVLPAWIDYNGHMTEFRYVQVFSDACEALLQRIGMYRDYVATGFSYYTAESHTQFFDEVGVGERMVTTAQILSADAKRMHVYYSMHADADDRVLATLEAMYLHVDMQSGRVCAAAADRLEPLERLAAAHAGLPRPDGVGRHVGQRRPERAP